MNPTTSVRTDALPAIATVFVPGAVVVAPLAFNVLAHHPWIGAVFGNSELLASIFALVACVAAGELVDSAGSYVEFYLLDRFHPNSNRMLENWRKYLALTWKVEPIGQRYLRRVLVEFKFELNLFVAIIAVAFEFCWLRRGGFISGVMFAKVIFALILIGVGLFRAALDSSRLLADIRALLLDAARHVEPVV